MYLYGLLLEREGYVSQARLRYEAALRLEPGLEPARKRLESMEDPFLAALERLEGRARTTPSPPAPELVPQPEPARAPEPPGKIEVAAPAAAAGAAPVRDPIRPERRPEAEPAPLVRPAPAPPRMPPAPQSAAGAGAEGPTLWAPPPPGFRNLVRAAVLLWAQRPLLWVGLFAAPNLLAGLLAPSAPEQRTPAMLFWVAAFGLGAGAALLQASAQWLRGRPFPASRFPLGRAAALTATALLYGAVSFAPWAISGALHTELLPAVLIMGALLFTVPLHALFAPGLMSVARGEKQGNPLAVAMRMAGRRTWLHLAVMLAAGGVVGGVTGVLGWAFAVTLAGEGEVVGRLGQVAAVSGAESLWAVLVTICGHDSLALAEE